jgi:hypothetical protein
MMLQLDELQWQRSSRAHEMQCYDGFGLLQNSPSSGLMWQVGTPLWMQGQPTSSSVIQASTGCISQQRV